MSAFQPPSRLGSEQQAFESPSASEPPPSPSPLGAESQASRMPPSELKEEEVCEVLHRRTLRFATSVAAELVFPNKPLRGGHTVGNGYYYELAGESLSADDVKKIAEKLTEIVEGGSEILRAKRTWKEACDYFQEKGLEASRSLLMSRGGPEVDCYQCRGVLRVALHPLYQKLSTLKAGGFSIVAAPPGLVAAFGTSAYEPQPALLGSHRDHIKFATSMAVDSVGAINALHQVGRGRKDFVLHCEFRQEAKLATIVRQVQDRDAEGRSVKVICIAGPTSSGKTTFANKLCMYLKNAGFVARPLTVDHYYLPLNRQPKYQIRQQRIDVDYDHIESMDVELVGEHLNALVSGKSVLTPVYNMKTGFRDEPGHHFDALPPNGILVIEGIHALNPLYTQAVDSNKIFKIFISPLTALQLDDVNAVKSTDHRLLRRMCRDYLFRGNSASITLKMWDNVRKGEGTWIFPHQNDADFVMNSAADYEIPVLKTFIEPLLRAVLPDDPNYVKATQLLQLLDRFNSWPPHLAPEAALIREFIGEGAFDCH